MANDTMQNDDETTGLRHFEAGKRALDRESDDDSQVLVLGAHASTAEKCYVAAIGQTIAEANPEYPASDAVADVAFVEGIEDAMGVDWEAADVLELYADGELDRARIKRYAYPEKRLEPIGNESDEESADACPDGGQNTNTNAHGDEVPVRCEPADFGGGEASGMDEL
ncbi:hypothetical protein [Halococcus thailandensis]|nr:hypothetical protein [Halococcus thailandensis]